MNELVHFYPGVAIRRETWALAALDGVTDFDGLVDWLELHPEREGFLLNLTRVKELCMAEIARGSERGREVLDYVNASGTLPPSGYKFKTHRHLKVVR